MKVDCTIKLSIVIKLMMDLNSKCDNNSRDINQNHEKKFINISVNYSIMIY